MLQDAWPSSCELEEAAIACSPLASNAEEGIDRLFDFLVNNARENELIRHVRERWSDLDAFEKDIPIRNGFAHQTMAHIAYAYQLTGDEPMFIDALRRFRASLDFQRSNGADSYLMELAEGYYFALKGDFDSALTHLERASSYGFKFDLQTSDYWQIYKPLDGNPRFEALKSDGHRKINSEREQVGMEPLSS